MSCSAVFVPSIVFPTKVLFLIGCSWTTVLHREVFCELVGSICTDSCSYIKKFYFLQVLFVDHDFT